MSSSFSCVRCGRVRSDHDRNLVNEPAVDGLAWIEEVKTGYAMDILGCMETPLPEDYLSRIEEMYHLEEAAPQGYVSPSPKEEEEAIEKSRAPRHYGSPTFVFTPGGHLFPLD